jgi:hypothetical protein
MESLEGAIFNKQFIKRAVIALCAIIVVVAIADYVFPCPTLS